MHRDFCAKAYGLLLLGLVGPTAYAQSISFSPAAPSAAQAITATFSEPFNCAAPQPMLTARSNGSLTFESILPNGIVHCPVIPVPPPTTTSFSLPLGPLSAGAYAVNWNIYLDQSPDAPKWLSSTSVALNVSAARGAGANVASTPLSPWALAIAVASCALAGVRRLRAAVARAQ